MGDIIKHRLALYLTVSLASLLLLVVYGSFSVFQWEKSFGLNERKIRVDYNNVIYKIEAVRDHAGQKSEDYSLVSSEPFTLVDLTGKVIYSKRMKYSLGEQINLHTLSQINPSCCNYIVPVSCNGQQFGTLILKLNAKNYRRSLFCTFLLFFPLCLGVLTVLSCVWLTVKLLKQDIFLPIKELHRSTRCIMQGNYDSPIVYDYDGSIGTLCHDFELMRSELKDAACREKSLKDKETLLLACISHDLKTPLASITGYVEGILYDVAEGKEDVREYAHIILQKAVGLNKLIDDILEHSKAQLNQFTIKKEELYAQSFFQSLLKELALDAAQREVDFTYEEIPDVLLSMDPYRITQVLRNLIDNSIKYGRKPGKIHVFFQLAGAFFTVTVEDNGIGISAADLPFIFDKFYRSDKARTQGIGGSGLGLSIAKYIIEHHGGRIECDSILGHGTTVTFSIPME